MSITSSWRSCPWQEVSSPGQVNRGLMMMLGFSFALGFSIDRKEERDDSQWSRLTSGIKHSCVACLCVMLGLFQFFFSFSCWILSVATWSGQAVQGGEQASPQLQWTVSVCEVPRGVFALLCPCLRYATTGPVMWPSSLHVGNILCRLLVFLSAVSPTLSSSSLLHVNIYN